MTPIDSREVRCRRSPLPALLLAVLAVGLTALSHGKEPEPARSPGGRVDFQHDVRPILSDVCFNCHGPDPEKRKAKLRLDTEAGAFADLGGYHAIVPGKPSASPLYKRIVSKDPDEKMPPPKSGRQLSATQIKLLKQWIEQGAKWQSHWAFQTPERPPVPKVRKSSWPRNPLDHFILARLELERLSPAPEAAKLTLIRRVTLDLTGLPPSPKEVDTFLADTSTDAYEKLVDRLLQSPHYGERMAMDWLDGARYADTNGYQVDMDRQMWRWRDWVIEAFNKNQPFDQFTVEQVAGDLLPNATFEQRVATGFNRNHRINAEGGAIPEEWRVEYVIDRVDTTATVWLGLTMGCARCHDHKYDPLTQKDFYRFYAFFNSVNENGLDGGAGNAVPLVQVPSPEIQAQIAAVDTKITTAQQDVKAVELRLPALQLEWEKTTANNATPWMVMDAASSVSAGGATLAKQADGSLLSGGKRPDKDTYTIVAHTDLKGITAVRLELLPDDSLPSKGPGRHENGNPVLSELRVQAAPKTNATALKPVLLQNPSADFSQQGYNVASAIDGKLETGWALYPEVGKPHFAVFETQELISYAGGTALTFTLDQNYGAGSLIGRFRLAVTAAARPASATSLPETIAKALAIPPTQRDDKQKAELTAHYRTNSAELKQTQAQVAALVAQKSQLNASIPTTMVMQELDKPRDTFMLNRGEYDKPGEKVTAAVPVSLTPLPKDAPPNRLGLARWLVDPANPLTARVAMNRYWQNYFGTGLVKTAENLGSQGERPSHPELLDWLATEFIRTGWNVKAMQKLIVTSATYRQASKVTKPLLEKDPGNRLLARGPRLRLPAELIRDQALAVSGLMAGKIGGPSVKPYQPAGLWEELSYNPKSLGYIVDEGENLYRRSMYTFWKRTVPPPSMTTFDAPGREICAVFRSRTSTPLQALALMNDVTYVEAARALAQRMLTEGGATTEQRIGYAFRLATARPPQPGELKIMLNAYQTRLAEYQKDKAAAQKLVEVGKSKRNEKLDLSELAAGTAVCNLILNLDEIVTKE